MPQAYPPLGLLYIGAVLIKNNHQVRLLDPDAEDCFGEKLRSFIKEYTPELIGITASTSIIKEALRIAKISKSIYPKVPIVIGGIHPTISPKETLENEYVDFIIIGEAEITVVEFVDALEKGKDLSKIDGIGYKRNGEIHLNKRRELIKDLDSIPFPDRDLLKNPSAYVPPDAQKTPVTSLITTRGCFGACTYCQTKNIFGRKLRSRSVENVIDEIKYCIKKYGIKEFHFADDNFVEDKKRVLDFCREVRKLDIKPNFVFFNGLRADNVDEEILRALKSIGVLTVGYGVESGNQEILNRIKKGIKLDTYRKAYKLSKKMGFQTWGFFMIGLPGETAKTIRDTINFAKELDPDFAKFLILKPFPGSEVFEELHSQNLIFNYDYELYGVYTRPVHRLPSLTAEEIFKWQKKAYREFYFRPKKLLQHVLRIKSFAQLMFNIKSAIFIFYKTNK